MRIAIIGSRSFNDGGLMEEKCDKILSSVAPKDIHIFSGGASGADSLADKYSQDRSFMFTRIPARWNDVEGKSESEIGKSGEKRYWKAAGAVRNSQLLENVEAVIAFWDGKSTGTKDMIAKATKKGVKVRVIKITA